MPNAKAVEARRQAALGPLDRTLPIAQRGWTPWRWMFRMFGLRAPA